MYVEEIKKLLDKAEEVTFLPGNKIGWQGLVTDWLSVGRVGKLMERVNQFITGDGSYLEIAWCLGESPEVIETLFELTSIMYANHEVCEGVTDFRILGTIVLMYLLRSNRSLRVRTFKRRLRVKPKDSPVSNG